MCPTITEFGAESWNAAFYQTMAVVAKASKTVQEKSKETSSAITFPAQLWLLERNLKSFVEYLKNPAKGHGDSAAVTDSAPSNPLIVVGQLESLVESIDSFYLKCRKLGFANRTLTGASLNAIKKHSEFIEDFADTIRIALDPRTEELFESARRQFEAGETVGMEAIH